MARRSNPRAAPTLAPRFPYLRRRKNCALFVAGKVTDLLAPSSVTLAVFVTQFAGGASVRACSNTKLAVSTDGQETIIPPCGKPERSTGDDNHRRRIRVPS